MTRRLERVEEHRRRAGRRDRRREWPRPGSRTRARGGGLPCAEVTFRTRRGRARDRRPSPAGPTLLVGAGTVIDVDQVDAAPSTRARASSSRRASTRPWSAEPGARRGRCCRASPPRPRSSPRSRCGPATSSSSSRPSLGGSRDARRAGRAVPERALHPDRRRDGPRERARSTWRSRAVLAVGGSWMVPPPLLAAARLRRDQAAGIRRRAARAGGRESDRQLAEPDDPPRRRLPRTTSSRWAR